MRAAFAPDLLIIIVLTVVSIAVIATFVLSLPLRSISFTSNAACVGVSFVDRIASALGGVSFSQGSLNAAGNDNTKLCPAQLVTISDRTSNDKAVKTIADQMVLCQRDYGAGTIDLFSQGKSQKDLYCVLCAYVNFTNDNNDYVTGLSNYLVSTQVPGKKESYAQYLGSVDQAALYKGAKLPQFTLTRKSDYGIFYFYGKKTSFFHDKLQSTTTGAAAGSIVGVPSGTLVGAIVSGALTGSEGGTVVEPGLGTIIGAAGGATVGMVIFGASTLLGAIGGAAAHAGDQYVGATVLVPWNRTSFDANHLKCDRIEGIP